MRGALVVEIKGFMPQCQPQFPLRLRFGWPGGIVDGKRKVNVVSGGLTGRIRRKYKLNSLLNPEAKTEEEAEQKNRNDDRHHALDAMVISFIPNWARNDKFTGFFRFPDGVHRELFAKEIAEVVPQNVCFEKAGLAETIYGARTDHGEKVIVQRAELVSLAMKPTAPGKSVFDLKYAAKQAQSVREPVIQERLMEFLTTNPDETAWRLFSAEFCLKRKDGSNGPRVEYVNVTVGEPTEYKDMSKDGTGAYRKALKGHKGQIVYWDAEGELCVAPVYPHDSVYKQQACIESLGGKSKFYGFFRSDCVVAIDSELSVEQHKLVVKNEKKQKRRIKAPGPLKPGKFILNTIITKSLDVELTMPNGTKIASNLGHLVKAGIRQL